MGALAPPTRKEHEDTYGNAELLLLGGELLLELPVFAQETVEGADPVGVELLKKAEIRTRIAFLRFDPTTT